MNNETTVMELKSGQIILTVPRALAKALGYTKGTKIRWELKKGEIKLVMVNKQ